VSSFRFLFGIFCFLARPWTFGKRVLSLRQLNDSGERFAGAQISRCVTLWRRLITNVKPCSERSSMRVAKPGPIRWAIERCDEQKVLCAGPWKVELSAKLKCYL
jgi:hypothetical protein